MDTHDEPCVQIWPRPLTTGCGTHWIDWLASNEAPEAVALGLVDDEFEFTIGEYHCHYRRQQATTL